MNILLVRVSSLGDVLHNMPIVADIRRHFPGANIDWVVEEGYVSLVRLNPEVRNIIPFALRRWRKNLGDKAVRAEVKAFFRRVREVEYDYVFDTQGLLKTGVIMGAARVRKGRKGEGGQKVGLANGSEGSGYEGISRIFHTKSIPLDPRTHAVARGRLVVGAALGYAVDTPADFGLPEIAVDEPRPDWLPPGPYAVYFHGTARDAKKWAPANWIALGRELAPMTILLPWGSPKEKAEAEALAAAMPNARVLPKLSMADAVMLARRAALAVGVDTGLTHIAAAFSRPVVEIYCDSPRWKTEGNWSPKIINLGDRGNPPSVADVAAAARSLL
ncbi:lipopolysaccharide heptosyltransferase I [Massilia dura]|uniref:Lipopolysaccharide heptosyltransferase 1 n=1 Tax=Pseudoduganella dura TaxID=321982 RepID=A0A6I3XRA8_9BURK|nr:lipopolysaccharide heptosyltransferase I [Pseudoduganella dura]MUI14315.1 lipopolysaccharide heptosyltransferase I [Pseudoduganella dura]GGX75862.1 LPS heptosyltransferase-1 [Pseudoduganella dura]